MNSIGNDSLVLNKVMEGTEKGYCELTLHGYDYVRYTSLSKDEQTNSLRMANEKNERLIWTCRYKDIEYLIDSILQEGISISSFKYITSY